MGAGREKVAPEAGESAPKQNRLILRPDCDTLLAATDRRMSASKKISAQ